MRTYWLLRAAIAFAIFPTVSDAQDFDAGLEAYRVGDYAAAFEEWQPLADEGDPEAQYALGVMYEFGEGVVQDHEAAARWYRLAAEQGNPDAQFNLANLHFLGKGEAVDGAEAAKWFRPFAVQGDDNAKLGLALVLFEGNGIEKDDVAAFMWLETIDTDPDRLGIEMAGYVSDWRDELRERMRPTDIREAERSARVCVESDYKDCDG